MRGLLRVELPPPFKDRASPICFPPRMDVTWGGIGSGRIPFVGVNKVSPARVGLHAGLATRSSGLPVPRSPGVRFLLSGCGLPLPLEVSHGWMPSKRTDDMLLFFTGARKLTQGVLQRHAEKTDARRSGRMGACHCQESGSKE